MPDTYTSALGAILMAIGGDNNTWGTNLNNAVIQILEDAVANTLTTTASSGALGPSNVLDLSQNAPPNGPSAARYAALVFNGAITANQTVKVPNLNKWWRVSNQTTGAFTVSIETSSGSPAVTGTPAAIPAGGWQTVYCDGNGDIIVWPFNTAQIQMPDGSAAAPAYSFIDDPTSGIYLKSTAVSDGAMNGSNAVLTCATSQPFQPSWVGRKVVVAGAGPSGAALVTTIAAYTSASQVTLAANSSTAVSAASVVIDGFEVYLGARDGAFLFEVTPLGMSVSGTPAVAGGGAGYNVGDTVTLAGGTFLRPAVLTVASVAAGAVTGVSVLDPGLYRNVPANPVGQASTSGSGAGATFTLAWANANVLCGSSGTSLLPALGLSAYMAALMGTVSASALVASLLASGAFGPFATATTIRAANLAPGAAPLPSVFAQPTDNLSFTWVSSSVVSYSPGSVRDDANVTDLVLAASIYKNLSAGFSAGGTSGTPGGACDSGSKGASQTWHLYLIGNLAQAPTTYSRSGATVTLNFAGNHGLGVGSTIRVIGIGAGIDGVAAIASVPSSSSLTYVATGSGTIATTACPAGTTVDGFDVLASQNYNSPTLPSGWTVKQCLGAPAMTDANGNIQEVFQYGDEFWLVTPVQSLTTFTTTGSSLFALDVPTGAKVQAIFNATALTNTAIGSFVSAYFTAPDQTDQTQSITAGRTQLVASQLGNTSVQSEGAAQLRCWTNTSAQVRVNMNQSGSQLDVTTVGWRDPRRRLF